MSLSAMQSWFKTMSNNKKAITILKVMYEMTIVVRSMSVSEDRSKLLAASMLNSEMNHRISNYAASLLSGQPSVPEDVIISMIDASLADDRFAGYAEHVWEKIVKEVDGMADS